MASLPPPASSPLNAHTTRSQADSASNVILNGQTADWTFHLVGYNSFQRYLYTIYLACAMNKYLLLKSQQISELRCLFSQRFKMFALTTNLLYLVEEKVFFYQNNNLEPSRVVRLLCCFIVMHIAWLRAIAPFCASSSCWGLCMFKYRWYCTLVNVCLLNTSYKVIFHWVCMSIVV